MTTRELATTEEARSRLAEIRGFVEAELKEGQDYGTIPGTQKPSLWQPGAEKLMEKLMLAPTFGEAAWIVEDHERGAYMVDVRCRLVHYPTGQIVAECIGSAARDAQEEIEASNQKALEYARRDGKADPVPRQLTMRDKGLARNTAVKMAQKSALVGAVLKAARLAVEFTQDIEDSPGGGQPTPSGTKQGVAEFPCPTCGGEVRTFISKAGNRVNRCDACDKFVRRPQGQAPKPTAEPIGGEAATRLYEEALALGFHGDAIVQAKEDLGIDKLDDAMTRTEAVAVFGKLKEWAEEMKKEETKRDESHRTPDEPVLPSS